MRGAEETRDSQPMIATTRGPVMASHHHQEEEDLDPTSIDSFIAIDMESLELLASPKDVLEPNPTPDPPRIQILKKTLSRKGSHRGGGEGERKVAEGGAAAACLTTAGPDVCDESAVAVHMASDLGTTSTSSGGGAGRRLGKRSSSPWLGPRRVLVLFATMSSMGTLVLLYLTLSMVGGEVNDQ